MIEEKEIISVNDSVLLEHEVSVLLSCGKTLLAELLLLENIALSESQEVDLKKLA